MPRLILLNGPAGSGKDFAGEMLRRADPRRVVVEKFARVLKEHCHAAYSLVTPFGEPLPHDHFEARKEQPCHEFMGLRPRQVYIAFSELLMKPLHGKDVFGRILRDDLSAMLEMEPETDVVVTDSGFREEAEALLQAFGAENTTLVRLHREGRTFAGDSRSYISLRDLGVCEWDLVNPGHPEGLARVLRIAGVLEEVVS